ncbi:LuxR C-terminal-related transcriptional regulator [Cohnella massiliensis]|uniref:LuxR C-terminal-related transcriptional regulator n=1 Tax=Cohnella massiliensis TaxID=1816691 RepID=UPI001593BE9E|nr:LuxR C-terminal-related transcriptional regulator [Cohnella massiliensis]
MTIAAPAGYGKTSLLQAWTSKQKRPLGWLRLDSLDDNLGRFLSYLSHAIPTLPAAYQKGCSDWIMAQEEDPLTHALEPLAAEWTARIQDSGQHVMIILDNCEYIRHPKIHRFLDLFLRFGPPQLHVMLSGRRLPGMEALKSKAGGISAIEAEDLALTETEIFDFVFRKSKIRLKENERRECFERTGGWFPGVTAYLALIRKTGYSYGDPDFHNRAAREVSIYFQNLAEWESPACLPRTLMALSAAKRLNRSLINRLAPHAGAINVNFETLVSETPFLLPMKDRPDEYAFLPMFASWLQERLKSDDPGSFAKLNKECALHAEEEGRFAEAATYALESGNPDFAAELMLRHAEDLLRSDNDALLALLGRFPANVLRRHSGLVFMYGWALIHARRFGAAEQMTDVLEMETVRANGANLTIMGESLGGYVASLRSMIHFSRGETDLGAVYMKQAYDELKGGGALFRKALYFSPYASSLLKGEYGYYGVLSSALTCYAYFKSHWDRQDMAYALFMVLLGECYYETNQLPKAEKHLRKGLQLALEFGNPGVFVPAYLAWARLKWISGAKEEAIAALQEAREQLIRIRSGHGLPLVDACETRFHLNQRNLKGVRRWMRSHPFPPDHIPSRDRMYEAVTLLRARLFAGELTDALTLGEKLLQMAESGNLACFFVEVNVILAQIYRIQGQNDRSLEKLNRAIEVAHAQRYVRTLADEGEALVPLLRDYMKMYRKSGRRALVRYAMKIAALLPQESLREDALFPASASLTRQEKRVLQYLMEGADNRNIAMAMSISMETVKRHCRHIYRKLGVRNRKQVAQQYANRNEYEEPSMFESANNLSDTANNS